MRPALPLLLAAAAACAVPPAQAATLVGLFHAPGNAQDCSLLALDTASGANVTLLSAALACKGVQSTYPAFSALDPATSTLYVAINTASAIFAYSGLASGGSVTEAPACGLPLMPDMLGLTYVNDTAGTGLLLVAQQAIYRLSGGALTLFANLSSSPLPAEGIVASAPSGGSSGAGLLYVANGAAGAVGIMAFDLGAMAAGPNVTDGTVAHPLDVQWSSAAGALIELASYKLYATDPASGASQLLLPIPDGPGYPVVNGISSDGATFWFIDFASIYTIDLAAKAIASGPAPFTAAPRVVGFPQWLSA